MSNNALYWHNGLQRVLVNFFQNLEESKEILINVNMDGLPISKSGKDEFWPILVNIYEMEHVSPFVVGIYYGKKKPESVNEYLQEFVSELKDILKEGILINCNTLSVRIRCFICDSPARAFIKGILSHFVAKLTLSSICILF